MNAHILYLALAVGRGHLMRAHRLRQILIEAGMQVDIITTSEAGQAFLAEMGTPATLLSNHFYIEYDDRQNLKPWHTEFRTCRYLLDPRRGFRDWRVLVGKASQADLVVNDSFHPALTLAPLGQRLGPINVVHVFGENIWQATESHFEARLPRKLNQGYVTFLRALKDRSFGQIVFTLAEEEAGQIKCLPALIPPLNRTPQQIHDKLGLGTKDKLAVVYLNPCFRSPALAEQIETTLTRAGFHLYGVSESYASRPGWNAQDPHLGDAIAAADLYISGLGMGALTQAKLFGTPFIGLLTNQPEQTRNVAYLKRSQQRFGLVSLDEMDTAKALSQAITALHIQPGEALLRLDPGKRIANIQHQWVKTFETLIKQAQRETVGAKPQFKIAVQKI